MEAVAAAPEEALGPVPAVEAVPPVAGRVRVTPGAVPAPEVPVMVAVTTHPRPNEVWQCPHGVRRGSSPNRAGFLFAVPFLYPLTMLG